jgi:hypothetical protein
MVAAVESYRMFEQTAFYPLELCPHHTGCNIIVLKKFMLNIQYFTK